MSVVYRSLLNCYCLTVATEVLYPLLISYCQHAKCSGVAAKQSRETSVVIVMSARPFVRSHETSCIHWTGFREVSYCGFLLKLVEQIEVC
jgi:hypothetical protein